MAIDTAAKRRNVGRIMFPPLVMGLSPSAGLNTDDRVNAAAAYIGFTYEEAGPAAPTFNNNIQNWLSPGVHLGILLYLYVRLTP